MTEGEIVMVTITPGFFSFLMIYVRHPNRIEFPVDSF